MQPRTIRKVLSDSTQADPSFRRRYASRCFVGIACIVTMVSVAHSQDAATNEATLRPSFQTCVEASRGVTLALNNCIGIEHAFQDKRLNAAYQQLRKSLPTAERLRLRDEERTWIAKRDKTCGPEADGGTASLLDANNCQLDATAARAAALEERIGR